MHDKPEELHKHKEADKEVPQHFWDKYVYELGDTVDTKKTLRDREDAIAKSAKYSYLYAKAVLKGAFSKGEKAIAKDAQYAYSYARLINKPFRAGEDIIAKSAIQSLHYAAFVLRAPFSKGEPAIAKFAEEDDSGNTATKAYLSKFPERKDAIEKLKG